MASKKTTRGKNTGKKKSTSKRTYNSKKKQNEILKQDQAVQDEIILIIAMVVSILIFLSYFDLSGIVGQYVSGFLFGMIGLLAYVLPFLIFFGTAFYISNLGNRAAGRKMLSAAVFLVTLTALIQLVSVDYDKNLKIFEYYIKSSNQRTGGGIIGGILVMFLCRAFDVTATYVILIAIMLISLIVISGKAIFMYIAKKSKNSLEERRQYRQLRMDQYEEEIKNKQEVNNNQELPQRSWKTFELEKDSNNKIDKKTNKKDKKAKSNVVQLFTPDEKDIDKTLDLGELDINILEPVRTPTYEDELNDKFGKSQTTEEDESVLDITDKPSFDSTNVVHDVNDEINTDIDQPSNIIKAHEKPDKPARSNDSTDVDKLEINQIADEKDYVFPPIKLLSPPKHKSGGRQMKERSLKETALKLQNTLDSFGVQVTITNVSCGPSVTRYELQPEHGVKVKSITSLADDIKLNLAASEIRIEAPIPGKSAVGIEVPNKENSIVTFRELIESKEFTDHPSDIAFAVGRDIGGQIIVTDIEKMPHLLIAGATGSGKSVCINTLIMSILYKSNPSDVRMIMIDPKVVELNVYNGIPQLLIPVVTDPKKAAAALNWAVVEMTDRYKKFADAGVRDLKGYNRKAQQVAHLNDESCQKLPKIVIIIDELADLMMVAPGEVEDSICRLAQMARAAGIYLIIATQRPSVNVITGLIKANIPSRIAFAVSSAIDSRTIIDGSGAEKLLGKGDMLFFPSGYSKPVRIQGSYVSDKEVSSVVDFLIKNNSEASYSEEIKETIANVKAVEAATAAANERDEYFIEAGRFIIEKDKASIGMLQRVYRIGFNRAARIMDQLAEVGVVGPEEGTKPRKILMSAEEYEQFIAENELSS